MRSPRIFVKREVFAAGRSSAAPHLNFRSKDSAASHLCLSGELEMFCRGCLKKTGGRKQPTPGRSQQGQSAQIGENWQVSGTGTEPSGSWDRQEFCCFYKNCAPSICPSPHGPLITSVGRSVVRYRRSWTKPDHSSVSEASQSGLRRPPHPRLLLSTTSFPLPPASLQGGQAVQNRKLHQAGEVAEA